MPRILIVEDDPATTFAFQTLLEIEGFEVDTASNGKEALEKIRANRPQAVMTDVRMPEMDGDELCRVLEQDPDTRDLPVIVVTGIAELGAFPSLRHRPLIRKPAEAAVIVQTLRALPG